MKISEINYLNKMYFSDSITIYKNKKALQGTVRLPASKSISNRLLIINALSKGTVVIDNLSNAKDSQVLKKRLSSEEEIMDVGDAGTAMRFLTAYKAVTSNNTIMKGSERMHQRPIAPLVDALRDLGADIEYMEKEGYPPLKLQGFNQVSREVTVPGNISSQFITALLLIAPILPLGIKLNISGKLMSRPYALMTISLLEKCGIEVHQKEQVIEVAPQQFQPTMISVESDWSSASYWFALVALIPDSDIILPGLLEESLQGDAEIVDIAKGWGILSEFTPSGLRIRYGANVVAEQVIDFSNVPDLAQTVAVVHALKGIKGKYKGLESLRIKETDRIHALQQELGKIGTRLIGEDEYFVLYPPEKLPEQVEIKTYQDHRMAMAFTALSSRMKVTIENRDVTMKSYPHFWDDLSSVDMELA
jgi:3-phosphoshikimate 1-carboxyvinyltransferase